MGDGRMRYQVTLENMTVALFAYWARRDLPKLLDGLDAFTATTDNEYELDATLTGFEGTRGIVLSFWVHQVGRDTVRVDWEQLFGGRNWADQIDAWLNFRFGVNGESIAHDGRALPRLNDEQLEELRAACGWAEAAHRGMRQYDYCNELNIDRKTLTAWRDKYRAMGFVISWPESRGRKSPGYSRKISRSKR
jgi:hypothetical protein